MKILIIVFISILLFSAGIFVGVVATPKVSAQTPVTVTTTTTPTSPFGVAPAND